MMEPNVDTICFILVTAFTVVLFFVRWKVFKEPEGNPDMIGPTYWGAYPETNKKESPDLVAIKLQKTALNGINPLAGGSAYSQGQAVKRARAK